MSATQFRPLEFTILKALYHTFGFRPTCIHLFYIFLHMVVIVELFYLAYLLTDKYNVAIVTTLLFAFYPRNIEAVIWIGAAENDVVMLCFILGACLAWLSFRKTNNKVFQYLTALFFVFGLFTKESAGPLPAIVVLIDLYLQHRLTLFSKHAYKNVWRSVRCSLKDSWPVLAVLVLYAVFDVFHLDIAYHSKAHSAYGFVGVPRLLHYALEYHLWGWFPFSRTNVPMYGKTP